jgi:hypothetical protein
LCIEIDRVLLNDQVDGVAIIRPKLMNQVGGVAIIRPT